ncbi:MAG: ABC transporter ATP-binding protein [Acidimicrobiales bacterium]|nr:ABC transporter ATP-binding protein [Acidimicrobiales bacterium]
MSLRLDDIGVTVPDGDDTLTILDGAGLEVGPGELVTITGRSGSGKSTLLAVAGLLRRPDRGEVTVAGSATAGLGGRERTVVRRDTIAFVFQSAQLFPSLTSVQQLELVAHIRRGLDGDARTRARDLLGGMGLGHRADTLPGHLSGGERQRVGIARALMGEPAVLLADEPTASLDPERGREIMELLATETHRRGLATVVVIHDPTHLDLADRCYDLRDGRLHPATTAAGGATEAVAAPPTPRADTTSTPASPAPAPTA